MQAGSRQTGKAGHTPVRLLEVHESFEPHVSAALTRLAYIHKEVRFSFADGFICVEGAESGAVKDLRVAAAHTLYREKILADSAPQRAAMYRRVFGL